jgi:P-type Cu+ transporter
MITSPATLIPSASWGSRILSTVGGTRTLKNIGADTGVSALFVVGSHLTDEDGPLKDASDNTKRLVNLAFGSPMLAKLTVPELIEHWKAIRTHDGRQAIPDFLMHALTTAIATLGIAKNDKEMITASAMLATLFAMAGHLEAGVEVKSLDGIAKLKAQVPQKARRLFDPADLGKFEDVDVGELKAGDHVLVEHGQPIPVDGAVTSIHRDGRQITSGAIKTSLMHDGEGVQHSVAPSSRVRQCAFPAEGTNMVVRAETTAAESALMSEIEFLEKAEQTPSRAAHGIKRGISNVYVPAMVAACAAQFAWTYYKDQKKHAAKAVHQPHETPDEERARDQHQKTHGVKHHTEKAVKRTAELAIKMAPCAIMAATLVIPFVKNALASSHGVMVRKEAALDTMKNITHVVTDLRGTLTKGITEFKGLHLWENEALVETADHALLGMIGKTQTASTHHVAEALKNAAAKAGHALELGAAEHATLHMNKGVSGVFGEQKMVVGNHALMQELGHDVPEGLLKAASEHAGSTAFFCHEVNGVKRFGFAGLQDELRAGTRQALDELMKRGVHVTVATGMEETSARNILQQLGAHEGITLRAGCSPQDKVEIAKALMADKKSLIAAVGDAGNDTPFMKHVEKHGGVAMAIKDTAHATTQEAASVVVEGIHQLPDLMTLSKRLSHALWLNVTAAASWMTLLVGSHVFGHEMKTEHASIAHEAPTFLLTLAGLGQSLSMAKGMAR